MRRRELLASKDGGVNPNTGRGTYNGYEYVDLKLTGSAANLMFATCNVGAAAETAYGNYYQWGAGATQYANTNQYYTGSTNPLPSQYDTARQVMGGDWRMPTKAEYEALIVQTTYAFTTINGVKGAKFSKTVDGKERYVFFPDAGHYAGGSPNFKGTSGRVWSSTPYKSSEAYFLNFGSGNMDVSAYNRNYGRSVRGVFKKT